MKTICSTKTELLQMLQLIRDAIAMSTAVQVDCDGSHLVLRIEVDMVRLVAPAHQPVP
jgi:hypothetical protein